MHRSNYRDSQAPSGSRSGPGPLSDLTSSSRLNRSISTPANQSKARQIDFKVHKRSIVNMRQSFGQSAFLGSTRSNTQSQNNTSRRGSMVPDSSKQINTQEQYRFLKKIEEERTAEKRAIDDGKIMLRGEISLLNSELYRLRTELPEIQLDVERYAAKLSKFKSHHDLQLSKLQELDEMFDKRLVEFKLENEYAMTELTDKFAITTDELNKRLQDQMDKIENSKITRIKREQQKLANELEKLNESYNNLEIEMNLKIGELRVQANLELDEIKFDMDKVKNKLQEEIDLVSSEIKDCKLENPRLIKGLENLTEKLNKLEVEFDSQKEKSDAFEEYTKVIRSEIDSIENQIHQSVNESQKLLSEAKRYEKTSQLYYQEFLNEQLLRRKIHNELQDLKGNIRVFCRVRPCFDTEKPLDIKVISPFSSLSLDQTKEYILLKIPSNKPSTSDYYNNNGSRSDLKDEHMYQTVRFGFDKVFDQYTNNSEIFEEISQLVQSAMDGFNVCIFAYGQTGSGKTHTMTTAEDGMIPRSVYQIFQEAENMKDQGWEYSITGQFLEIYNENINDLMTDAYDRNLDKKSHDIIHDEENQTTLITDLISVKLESPSEVSKILAKAMKNRMTASTKSNERSSRSHSLFLLTIEGNNYRTGESTVGRLNLIDLAGSERVKNSQVTGSRLKETQMINKSLSALSDVILILNERRKGSHIPFRNSKLTHLLKYSLGGKSKTLMFVNISSNINHSSETLNSLRFAEKVNDTKMNRLSNGKSPRKSLPHQR